MKPARSGGRRRFPRSGWRCSPDMSRGWPRESRSFARRLLEAHAQLIRRDDEIRKMFGDAIYQRNALLIERDTLTGQRDSLLAQRGDWLEERRRSTTLCTRPRRGSISSAGARSASPTAPFASWSCAAKPGAEAGPIGKGLKMIDCSIIIPVLNQEFLTQQCLDTLLGPARDRSSAEIIVVDDGSVRRPSGCWRATARRSGLCGMSRTAGSPSPATTEPGSAGPLPRLSE